MHLDEFILQNMEVLVADWVRFARSLPPGSKLNTPALRDDAHAILRTVAEDMRRLEGRQEDHAPEGGGGRDDSRDSAQRHTGARIREGFDLNQLVAEYQALRSNISRLWIGQLEQADTDALSELARLNEALDRSLNDAIRQYSEQIARSREQSMRELHEIEDLYSTLAEMSPEAILLIQNGRFVYANPAAVRLLCVESEREIVGRAPFDVLEAEFHETVRKRMRSVLAEGQALPLVEYRFKRQDGQAIYVEASSSPVMWKGNPAIQIVGRDITERKSREEEQRVAIQRKDEFLATLAHELRNPLAPIQTGIEVLRMASEDPRMVRSSLEMMERQINHLVRLVDDLLDVSRINRGKILLRLQPVDLNDAVRKAVEATSGIIYADGRQVVLDLAPETLVVKADPVRLVQVFGNLLSNAGKYTESNGRIWVRTRRDGPQAEVSVKDDGAGVSPEMLHRLFEMFVQAHPDQSEGLGIGLALAKNLVTLHEGSIEARSEGHGKGSEFVVYLPLQEGISAKAGEMPAYGRPRLAGKTVVIADDNKDATGSLGALLEMHGAQVHIANDGPTALALVKEVEPDLALLDIGMPGMDGYEVARSIRAWETGGDIRLVALTGWGQEEDRKRTTEAGFDAHLVKPMRAEDLDEVTRKFF